ncbi:hypothetical protein ACP70R_032940 [Stipagrostis hirtigluma subsp. patula]
MSEGSKESNLFESRFNKIGIVCTNFQSLHAKATQKPLYSHDPWTKQSIELSTL